MPRQLIRKRFLDRFEGYDARGWFVGRTRRLGRGKYNAVHEAESGVSLPDY